MKKKKILKIWKILLNRPSCKKCVFNYKKEKPCDEFKISKTK